VYCDATVDGFAPSVACALAAARDACLASALVFTLPSKSVGAVLKHLCSFITQAARCSAWTKTRSQNGFFKMAIKHAHSQIDLISSMVAAARALRVAPLLFLT
jgi:hypothetical protein